MTSVARSAREVVPEDLMTHPGHLLRRAQQSLNTVWAEEVSRTLTSPQFAVLNVLAAAPALDQRTMGERAGLDRSTSADVIGRLTERGLVRWTRDRRDGRRKLIELTESGWAELSRAIPLARRVSDRLTRALTAPEREELLRLLALVIEPEPAGAGRPRP